jgi:hypothetical protein
MSKFVQSISATGVIRVEGQAASFCPDAPVDFDGHAILAIKVRHSTLKALQDERVTIIIGECPLTAGKQDF